MLFAEISYVVVLVNRYIVDRSTPLSTEIQKKRITKIYDTADVFITIIATPSNHPTSNTSTTPSTCISLKISTACPSNGTKNRQNRPKELNHNQLCINYLFNNRIKTPTLRKYIQVLQREKLHP